MTRRRRIVLLVLLLVAGVPILAAVGIGAYLRWHGLEHELSVRWTAYGMPGRLEARRAVLLGVDTAEIEGLTLSEDGQPPLVVAERIHVRFDLLERRLLALRIEGVTGGLDAQRLQFLFAILKVEEKHPPTRAPRPVTVDVIGRAEVPGGLAVEDAVVHVDALGAAAQVTATGTVEGRPLRLAIQTRRARPDAPVITTIEVKEGSANVRKTIAAVVGLGLIEAPPDESLPYLPEVADATGTIIDRDVVSDTFTGPVKARWAGGTLTADLDVDRRRTVLDRLIVHDDRMGDLTGRVETQRRGKGVVLDAAKWTAGPGMPLPPRLPLERIASMLPTLQIAWPIGANRTRIVLSGIGKSRLEVQLGGGLPPRVEAAEMPLDMAQGFLPAPLRIEGHAETITATLADGRPDISLKVRQARFIAEGWSFGPLDGQIAAVAAPGAGIQVTAVLQRNVGAAQVETAEDGFGRPIGRIAFAGMAGKGTLNVECGAVEGLLARLRGPVQMPDLRGRLALEVAFESSGHGATVKVRKLDLDGAELNLKGQPFIRALDARLRGSATVDATTVAIDLGGHLRSAMICLPPPLGWLPIATDKPIFAVDLVATLSKGALAVLDLRRAVVRAADESGQPLPGGWSAQFDGRLEGEELRGAISGVFDHANLDWVSRLIVAGEVKLAGEGAGVVRTRLERGSILSVDGSFWPLGADLDIDRGKLKVEGITGAINFTVGGEGRP